MIQLGVNEGEGRVRGITTCDIVKELRSVRKADKKLITLYCPRRATIERLVIFENQISDLLLCKTASVSSRTVGHFYKTHMRYIIIHYFVL